MAQPVQETLAISLYVPAEQSEHALVGISVALVIKYFPAMQDVQDTAPAPLKVPEAQRLQAVLSTVVVAVVRYLPAAHLTHGPSSPSPHTEPASSSESAAADDRNEPAGQEEHADVSPSLN